MVRNKSSLIIDNKSSNEYLKTLKWTTLGQYKLTAKTLGTGSFATVVEARHIALNVKVTFN